MDANCSTGIMVITMISLLIISSIAIIYAFIRAKHDSYISFGKWKTWAFIEAVLIDLSIVILTMLWFHLQWWFVLPLALIFAFTFWLFFDCMEGYLRTGNILHLGEQGFDLKMRKTFLYDQKLLWWKHPGAFLYMMFKIFWITLLTLIYFAVI